MAGSNEIKTELDLRPLGAQQAKTDPGTGPVAPPAGGTGTAPGIPAVSGAGSTKPPVAAPRAGTVDSMGRVVVQSKRRRVKLAPPPKKLDLDVAVYGDNNFFAGFDNKIATGGLFVSSLETLPVGHELELDVNLEGAHIKVKGKDETLTVSRIYSHLFKQM